MPVTNISASHLKITESRLRFHVQYKDLRNRFTVPGTASITVYRNGVRHEVRAPPSGKAEYNLYLSRMPAGFYKIVFHADSVTRTYSWGTFFEPEAIAEVTMRGDAESSVMQWSFVQEDVTVQTDVSLPDSGPAITPAPAPSPAGPAPSTLTVTVGNVQVPVSTSLDDFAIFKLLAAEAKKLGLMITSSSVVRNADGIATSIIIATAPAPAPSPPPGGIAEDAVIIKTPLDMIPLVWLLLLFGGLAIAGFSAWFLLGRKKKVG